MEKTKNKVGRPKGYRYSEQQKQQISDSMKNYYANMTDEQRKNRETCNNRKHEIYQIGLKHYYNELTI